MVREDFEKIKTLFIAFAKEVDGHWFINDSIYVAVVQTDSFILTYRLEGRDLKPNICMMLALSYDEPFHLLIRKKRITNLKFREWNLDLEVYASLKGCVFLTDQKKNSQKMMQALLNDFAFQALFDKPLGKKYIDICERHIMIYMDQGANTFLDGDLQTKDLKEMAEWLEEVKEAIVFAWTHRY